MAELTEIAKKLREPFPPEKVGKLPRVTCPKCRDSRARVCDDHAKQRCSDCHNWISTAHIHLDYVGHADVTDRLLEADPTWTWEPFALDEHGLPAIDENGGMWIRLTIAGVTRIGYGDADGKRGGAAVKEMIGDALRNASMRFGVGLDLWRKEGVVEESTEPRRQSKPATDEPSEAQEATARDFADEIAAAEEQATIDDIATRARRSVEAGRISRPQYNQLGRMAAARVQMIGGQRDSAGDSDGGSAEPGPASPGPRPDGPGTGERGPGGDTEAGSSRPGVQHGIRQRDGVSGAAQARGGDRGAPAAAGGGRV